jgi:hypothetical protein
LISISRIFEIQESNGRERKADFYDAYNGLRFVAR